MAAGQVPALELGAQREPSGGPRPRLLPGPHPPTAREGPVSKPTLGHTRATVPSPPAILGRSPPPTPRRPPALGPQLCVLVTLREGRSSAPFRPMSPDPGRGRAGKAAFPGAPPGRRGLTSSVPHTGHSVCPHVAPAVPGPAWPVVVCERTRAPAPSRPGVPWEGGSQAPAAASGLGVPDGTATGRPVQMLSSGRPGPRVPHSGAVCGRCVTAARRRPPPREGGSETGVQPGPRAACDHRAPG